MACKNNPGAEVYPISVLLVGIIALAWIAWETAKEIIRGVLSD